MQDNKLNNYLQSNGFSVNILDTLKERYGDWVVPNITRVRIIQKLGSAFLEINYNSTGSQDMESERLNLDFIIEDLKYPHF